jgi:integrase
MKTHNAENERIKRRYFAYLKEAMRQSEQTLDAVAKSLARFEDYTRHKDFKAFHHQQAVAFKGHLAEQKSEQSGNKLSKATLHATLANLKRFFHWLAGQPGYKSRIQYSDADYFNLSEKDMRVATAKREQKAPTLEQVKHVIANMPVEDEIARRNRALVAFTLLTGARDSAIASMKLKHVDIVEGNIFQDAREVSTKFSKTFTTYFFPVGDEIKAILVDWVKYLRDEKLWGNDDPLFPSTLMQCGASRQFEVGGLKRECWSNASPIRKIFREAFDRAGLPYFNPHSFRHMLVRYGQQVCKTPEDFKAWSQNLGHEQVLTTFLSYGGVDGRRQGEIIKGLGKSAPQVGSNVDELAEALFRRFREAGVSSAT